LATAARASSRCVPITSNAKVMTCFAPSMKAPVPQNADPIAKPHSAVAFDVIGPHRLEARAAVANGRGNGALRKVGAMQEGILRQSFLRNGEYLDQTLWTILDEDWRRAKSVWGPRVH